METEKLRSQKKGFEERYFTLKRSPTWETYLTRKQYLKILSASEETSLTLTDVSVQLENIPKIVPYTKKDGSTYRYLDFSRINLMNALKAAVYNMRYEMRDMVKPFFKDYREIGKFLDVLTQTGGYYIKGEENDVIRLNALETPAYQAAASQLISKINELTPKILGTTNKNLIISFKE